MTPPILKEALRLSRLPKATVFPRKLIEEVPLYLPLTVISVPELKVSMVRTWLQRRGINHQVTNRERYLHGILVAQAGHGIVFIDQNDDDDEQRFTLAHETAHFVLDHMTPREAVIKSLGETIIPVLDGDRLPTKEEAIAAVLRHVHLGIQFHLMERAEDGSVTKWRIEDSERLADRLALELLAPHQRVQKELAAIGEVGIELAASLLILKFGLPIPIALSYARQIRRRDRSSSSFAQSFRSGR